MLYCGGNIQPALAEKPGSDDETRDSLCARLCCAPSGISGPAHNACA